MKRIGLFMICLCLFITPVNAFYCRYEDLSYYKKLASNIHVSYDYEEVENSIKFTVIIANLQPNYYIVDMITGTRYNYTGNDIQIPGYRSGQSLQYTIYIQDKDCGDQALNTIRLTLPTYNRYYKDSVCEGITDYNLCNRWSSHGLDYMTFVKKVSEYKEGLKQEEPPKKTEEEIPDNSIVQWVMRFLGKYYYVFLIVVIIISSIGIYKINKKDSMYY